MSDDIFLNCVMLLEDPRPGPTFQIQISPKFGVGILKQQIYEGNKGFIPSPNMKLWKLESSISMATVGWQERLKNLSLQPPNVTKMDMTFSSISNYLPNHSSDTQDFHIIIQLETPVAIADFPRSTVSTQVDYLQIIRKDYLNPEKVSEEDLELNRITHIDLEAGDKPILAHQFINDFYKMLTEKAVYTPDSEITDPTHSPYITLLKRRLNEHFDDHFTPAGSGKLDPMDEYEATSYITAASRHFLVPYVASQWSGLMTETCITGAIVNPALVRLKNHFYRNTVVTPIPIRGKDGGEALWSARPDLSISYGVSPTRYATLLGESESKGETPGDAILKMALMSLHAWRISQMYGATANHVVMLVYVSTAVCTIYIFYKDPSYDGKFCMQCILREDDMLGNVSANVKFIRMLFNFAANSHHRGRPCGEDYVRLKGILERLGGSERLSTQSGGQRNHYRRGGPSASAGGRIGEGPSAQGPPAADQVQLVAAGYTYVEDPTLYSYRHVLRLHSKGRHLVAKWTTDNEEHLILTYLKSAKSQTYKNPVILVEEFLGPWIIMPFLTVLSELHGLSQYGCLDLYSQLVSAVAFLHEQGVVHMDLKPRNLVFQNPTEPHGLLSIIDFSLAEVYKEGDEPFSDFRGTEGWTAPEIRKGVKYNPRYAEIWAIGCVTRYFFEISELEDTLSGRLMSDIPSERPTASFLCSEIPLLETGGLNHPYHVPGPNGSELPFVKKPPA